MAPAPRWASSRCRHSNARGSRSLCDSTVARGPGPCFFTQRLSLVYAPFTLGTPPYTRLAPERSDGSVSQDRTVQARTAPVPPNALVAPTRPRAVTDCPRPNRLQARKASTATEALIFFPPPITACSGQIPFPGSRNRNLRRPLAFGTCCAGSDSGSQPTDHMLQNAPQFARWYLTAAALHATMMSVRTFVLFEGGHEASTHTRTARQP